jgi:hypothetical protein
MASFRVDRVAAVAALAMFSIFAPGVQALDRSGIKPAKRVQSLAQSENPAPRRLLPRRPVSPEPAAEENKQTAPEKSTPLNRDRTEANPRSGIEINRLQGPDPQDIGTIDEQSGGLGRSIWAGTPASLVARLIRQLPDAVASPAMRDLLRRLLLTAAVPPARDEGENAPNLVALRVERLQAMGLLGSASTLMEIVPNRDRDADLIRLNADNLLLRGDAKAACAESQRQEVRLEERYWQQLLFFCHVLEGNIAEATLGANLLAEGGELNDRIFMILADGLLNGNTPAIDKLGTISPLQIAMLRHARVPLAMDDLGQVDPSLLAVVATTPDVDLDLRLSAAEQAAQLGAMTPERLKTVYADAPFSGEELENALSIAEGARSPRGRALLYQAAIEQDVPTARAEVLRKALILAREDGVYALTVRLYRPMLEALAPSAELSWFAGEAAHALYALDRVDLARSWVLELRYAVVRDPAAKPGLDALWALSLLAKVPESAETPVGTPEAWRMAVSARAPDRAPREIIDAMALLEFQDLYVDRDGWRKLLSKDQRDVVGRQPGYAYRAALTAAAEAGRLGELILLAVSLLGDGELADVDLAVLGEIVAALKQGGLDAEARALVVEVAVEKGL